MENNLKQYLEKEFRENNNHKYLKYFETWLSNLTDNQLFYYKKIWMK